MLPAATRSAVPATRLVAAALAGSTALTLALPWSATVSTAQAAGANRAHRTTITVRAGTPKAEVPVHQLGVNHRFVSNGHGMWDPAADAPDPVVIRRLKAAGVNAIRYPGGIVGNLFDWKKAVGDSRGCQIHAQWTPQGFGRVRGNSYGPDEHMEVVEKIGAMATLVVPFVTGTPRDAADLVEYMNTPAGGGNPNGGKDWAKERARNGHPQPYNVRWWEIGNEQRIKHQRYWMSPDTSRAVRQYANGATVHIEDEMLGRGCRHWNRGARSNGERNQVFQLLYRPAEAVTSVKVIDSQGNLQPNWQETTNGGLAAAAGGDHVYEVDPEAGEVRFGDDVNGAALPKGFQVRASYTLHREGVFAYMRAMREVDPNIKTCATWGLRDFIRVAKHRRYNCFAVHSWTHFKAEGAGNWATPIEGHDQGMLGTARERGFVSAIKRALPDGTSLAITEFGAIWGDTQSYPQWMGSMTKATYMASMWVSWLDLGIPLASGSDLLAKSHRGLLGPAPDFVASAEALTRKAIKPLFVPNSRRLAVWVKRNPVRHPAFRTRQTYRALAVTATRARHEVRMLVVNRHPTKGVRARVDLRGFASRGHAVVSRVNGPSFRSWNTARVREVHLRKHRRPIGRNSFVERFPAHSVTVIRIPSHR